MVERGRIIRGEPSITPLSVYINVGGLVFETRKKTLNRFPGTLLGDDTKRREYFSPCRNEYFFNRHRESFASILFFYQSPGKLCRPGDVNLKVFIEECEFFQLPQWAVDIVKRKEGGFMEDDIIEMLKSKPEANATTIRDRIWNFLEKPTSSKYAMWFAYVYVCSLFLSIIICCLKTVKEFRPKQETHAHDGWEIADIAMNTYFLAEFLIRFIIAPNKIEFFKRSLVWIDFIALVTFIPLINKHYSSESVILFFTPFQLFRVIRVFHIAKMMPNLNLTTMVIKNSLDDFKVFTSCFLFFVIFSGTILYYLEYKEEDTTFTSVPVSMYWAVQTLVTLGYGDMVPTTALGKFFASVFICCCIPTLSVPVLSLLIKLSQFYEYFDSVSE